MRKLMKLMAPAAILLGMISAAAAYPATTTTDLNMRAGPGTKYRVVMVLPRGAMVDVQSCQSSWCRVAVGSRVGYASQRYLAVRQGRAAPSAPPPFIVEIIPPWSGRGHWDRPHRSVCDEREAGWAIGRYASDRTVEHARQDAHARVARVIGPDDYYTQDYRRDRLTIEVNRRNIIRDVDCG